MSTLAPLLSAWWGRSDLPGLDPVTVLHDPEAGSGVRSAAALLVDLAGMAVDLSHGPHLAAALDDVRRELAGQGQSIREAASRLEMASTEAEAADALWSVLCPAAASVAGSWEDSVAEVRAQRSLRSVIAPDRPIRPDEVIVTANALFTSATASGERLAWYDHPTPVEAPIDRHEVVHGLRELDRAALFERDRGVLDDRLPVLLSISATHSDVDSRPKVIRDLLRETPLTSLDVVAFDEPAVERLVDEVLVAPIERAGGDVDLVRSVLGVSGPYGRHYSFLKALPALWSVVLRPHLRGTFKIDLDQAFPQERLVTATGRSAFELLCDPVWGGRGIDHLGRTVALDFVAGSLVSERDIEVGLHVSDTPHPGSPATPEDMVFPSALPQAVSTEAEMLPGPDAPRRRVHVTGGMTGCTIAAVRRHRPFVPSFWGRAEDQAYGLSMWRDSHLASASLHLRHLVMRHDNARFATPLDEAIDKLVGDHERILFFSAYAGLIDGGDGRVATELWPFTGAFVSSIPVTSTYLRWAVTTLALFGRGRVDDAERLATDGLERIDEARRFTSGDDFGRRVGRERTAWGQFHDAVDELERGLGQGSTWAIECRARMGSLADACRVGA